MGRFSRTWQRAVSHPTGPGGLPGFQQKSSGPAQRCSIPRERSAGTWGHRAPAEQAAGTGGIWAFLLLGTASRATIHPPAPTPSAFHPGSFEPSATQLRLWPPAVWCRAPRQRWDVVTATPSPAEPILPEQGVSRLQSCSARISPLAPFPRCGGGGWPLGWLCVGKEAQLAAPTGRRRGGEASRGRSPWLEHRRARGGHATRVQSRERPARCWDGAQGALQSPHSPAPIVVRWAPGAKSTELKELHSPR